MVKTQSKHIRIGDKTLQSNNQAISGRKRWVDEVPRSSVALVGLKTAQIKVKGPISGWWLSLERDSAALWESL